MKPYHVRVSIAVRTLLWALIAFSCLFAFACRAQNALPSSGAEAREDAKTAVDLQGKVVDLQMRVEAHRMTMFEKYWEIQRIIEKWRSDVATRRLFERLSAILLSEVQEARRQELYLERTAGFLRSYELHVKLIQRGSHQTPKGLDDAIDAIFVAHSAACEIASDGTSGRPLDVILPPGIGSKENFVNLKRGGGLSKAPARDLTAEETCSFSALLMAMKETNQAPTGPALKLFQEFHANASKSIDAEIISIECRIALVRVHLKDLLSEAYDSIEDDSEAKKPEKTNAAATAPSPNDAVSASTTSTGQGKR